jgi:hypothetical protein
LEKLKKYRYVGALGTGRKASPYELFYPVSQQVQTNFIILTTMYVYCVYPAILESKKYKKTAKSSSLILISFCRST